MLLKKIIPWLLVLAFMVLIFCFSRQEAKESSKLSDRVSYRVVETTGKITGRKLKNKEIEKGAQKIEGLVRKLAHVTEYGILALLLLHAFYKTTGLTGKSALIASLLICMAYASSDEFHQLFVAGRAGRLTDVFIDTGGSAIFGGIAIMIINIRNRKRRSN